MTIVVFVVIHAFALESYWAFQRYHNEKKRLTLVRCGAVVFFAVLMIAMCDVVQWISSCHAFCIMDYRQCCPSATANLQKNTSRVGVLKLSIKTINCCCKPDLYIRLASEAATSKASNFDNNTKQLVT